MKKHIYIILTLFSLSLLISCDDSGYNQGYNAGKRAGYNQGQQAGYTKGQQAGYTKGYNVGLADGLSKSSQGIILFDSVNTDLWKVINWISIIAILISLIIVVIAMISANIEEYEWRKIVAKILVLLLSLLVSYFIIPKINFIWFFNPGISILGTFIVYILSFLGVFFLGKYLVDLFYRKAEIAIEMLIIFIASFFIWFISYLLLNSQYLFGNKPLFGNNLIICITIGIISVIIYSLLHPHTSKKLE